MVDAVVKQSNRPVRVAPGKLVLVETEQGSFLVELSRIIGGDTAELRVSGLTAPVSIKTIDKVSTTR